MLLEPAILLLDDPTAAIDSETEHEIFEALDRAIAGRTTFIVAHRLSTLRRADLIIVLENGRIVQRGPTRELIRVPGPVPARREPPARRRPRAPGDHREEAGHERRKARRDLILVQRVRDEDDDEEQFKPLDWRPLRRLLTYARPVRRKLRSCSP